MKSFINFVREQGVVGLAVGFILGGAVSKVVASFVSDIINPLLGIVLGAVGDLSEASVMIGGAELRYGNFLTVLIDFLIISSVVYFGIKGLRLEKLDKKKESV